MSAASKAVRGLAMALLMLAAAPSAASANRPAIPGCDPRIEEQLARASIEYIDRTTELARAFFPDLPEGGFRTLSCLDRLLGAGVNVIFAPPDIGAIMNAITNRVCALAQQHVNRVIQPLNQQLQGSIDFDRILPGIGLGRLTAGIALGPGAPGTPIMTFPGVQPARAPSLSSNGIFAR